MDLGGWSALILAAGAGRRFGGSKLVADIGGRPLIRQVADRVACADFAELVVVTGADRSGVRAALAGLTCRIVDAPDWAEGVAASLRTGIAALDPAARGVCVFLGDMPRVPVDLSRVLAERAEASGYAARPRHVGKPGHPVAFTQEAFADLMALQGDEGAASLLKARAGSVAYVDTAESGVLLDIDTPADLAAVAAAWKA